MAVILAFVASYMSFLWEGARFRITGSEVTTSNGGDAWLLVESNMVRLRFVCDRKQLFLDFQSISGSPNEWYSVDLIRRMLIGKRETSSFLNVSYAMFIQEHLDEIERRFSDEYWEETRAVLRRLRSKRAKET